ncbi:uncharacterized protein LOC102201387 [Pundamilia nyererei]|uniref:Uncharacterized protein LOC102201387 n=1 Tax=Pundamilia nyererei TaxID=303518 RepID=A0A9Y3VSQ5_9CICH|nr:PREDICTED: uncharacterized protein LOC102201387 [Pundamilia nyererei]
MRVDICCCLFVLALGCNLTAGIKHKIIRDKESFTLRCPLSVEGKVTWSRESHGSKAAVLTTDGDVDVRHSEDTRFGSLPDKSLVILKPTLSDSGRYLCNNEPAVQLTVISPGGRETSTMTAAERDVADVRVVTMMRVNICCCLFAFFLGCNITAGIKHDIIRNKESVTLRCPHPVEGEVTWSRENKGRIVDILTADGNSERRLINDTRFMSSADKWLIILRPAASDSGRYLCNNKPAVQLTVISPGQSASTPFPANATSAPPTNSDQQLLLGLIYGTAASFICIIIIIIIVASVFYPARSGSNKQGSERKEHVYHYIIDDVRLKAENAPSQIIRTTG